jgi:MFS transporter, MCT family, solute carrier family 16 (monocarboxylic acid transporters), member 10
MPQCREPQYWLQGLIIGRWLDLGCYRIPFMVAAVTLVVAQLLVAECKSCWQFLLCQGFLIGVINTFPLPMETPERLHQLDSRWFHQWTGYWHSFSLAQVNFTSCSLVKLTHTLNQVYKKRSRVYGIVATDSSVGATVIPIATRKLIPTQCWLQVDNSYCCINSPLRSGILQLRKSPFS